MASQQNVFLTSQQNVFKQKNFLLNKIFGNCFPHHNIFVATTSACTDDLVLWYIRNEGNHSFQTVRINAKEDLSIKHIDVYNATILPASEQYRPVAVPAMQPINYLSRMKGNNANIEAKEPGNKHHPQNILKTLF